MRNSSLSVCDRVITGRFVIKGRLQSSKPSAVWTASAICCVIRFVIDPAGNGAKDLDSLLRADGSVSVARQRSTRFFQRAAKALSIARRTRPEVGAVKSSIHTPRRLEVSHARGKNRTS